LSLLLFVLYEFVDAWSYQLGLRRVGSPAAAGDILEGGNPVGVGTLEVDTPEVGSLVEDNQAGVDTQVAEQNLQEELVVVGTQPVVEDMVQGLDHEEYKLEVQMP